MEFNYILLTTFVLFIVFTTAHKSFELDQDSQNKMGRIKAIDDLLLMHGQQLNEASDLEKVMEEMERLAKGKDLIEEHTSYYVSTLKKLMDKGTSEVLKKEQQRLNSIITSASYQPDGDTEIKYALVRRNIVSAFVDSIANYFITIIEDEPEKAFEKIRMATIKTKKTLKTKTKDGREEVKTIEL